MHQKFRTLLRGLRRWHDARGEKYVKERLAQLQELEFFHSIHFGGAAHTCPGWKSDDGMFHSDAHTAVVVTRKGKVSGVVAFELVGSTILIRQLQGAPRGNFHDGTRVEAYVLECAEQIARALNMKTLRIVDAETAIAYRRAAPEADRPSSQAEVHMQKIYSFPAQVGYAASYFWRVRRKTFVRALS